MLSALEHLLANGSGPCSPEPPPQAGVDLLLEALNRARILGLPDGNLAVDMSQLDDVGRILLALLRSLHKEAARQEGPLPALAPSQLGLTLTIRASATANIILQPHRGQIVRLDPTTGRPIAPHWDRKRRELRLGNLLIRRFRRRAPHQELILTTFEQSGWPPRIENPLPDPMGASYDEQLHDAIKRLNRNQVRQVLAFRGDGSGRGVLWGQV